METEFIPHLELLVKSGTPELFSTLLQSGMQVKTNSGETIGSLLCGLPGFTPSYVSERVQTIFLNGIANDDLQTPVHSGATLAITTAMPGLAGAIFRKNSPHAPLRTVPKDAAIDDSNEKDGAVTLKLFGAIAKERGAGLLEHCVKIQTRDLDSFFSYRQSLLMHIVSCTFNGDEITPGEILSTIKGYPFIYFTVCVQL